MSVRKRTWTGPVGVARTAWVYDHVDPATGKRAQPVIRDHLGKPATSKAQAERIAAATYVASVASVASAATHHGAIPTLTLSELLALHAKRRDISDATRGMESCQTGHLLRLLPDAPVDQITTVLLEDYATVRQSEATGKNRRTTVSGATVKKEIALLAYAMRWARERSYIQHDPPRLPRIVTQSRLPRCLTREEIALFFDACGDDDAFLRQLMEFAYLTGLRRAELFRLKWAEVDLSAMRITFTTQKRGNSPAKRVSPVYLSDRACELLKRRKTSIPREIDVFAHPHYYRDGRITTTLQTDIRSAARRAQIPQPLSVGMHAMRHSCASHLIEAGATIPEVAAHLRHRDGGALLLRTYAHTHEPGLRRAAGLLTPAAPATDTATNTAATQQKRNKS